MLLSSLSILIKWTALWVKNPQKKSDNKKLVVDVMEEKRIFSPRYWWVIRRLPFLVVSCSDWIFSICKYLYNLWFWNFNSKKINFQIWVQFIFTNRKVIIRTNQHVWWHIHYTIYLLIWRNMYHCISYYIIIIYNRNWTEFMNNFIQKN